MTNSKKEFKFFAESYITRYTNGGFLAQDTVELIDKYKSDKQFKQLPQNIKDAIVDLFNQGVNIRVVDIVSKYANGEGNDVSARGTQFSIVVAPEIMPGKTDANQAITVPSTILKVISTYPNLPKIPKKFEYQFDNIITPVEYKFKDYKPAPNKTDITFDGNNAEPSEKTRKTQQGKTLKSSDTSLKNKNIKITHESIQQTGDPIMENYLSELHNEHIL